MEGNIIPESDEKKTNEKVSDQGLGGKKIVLKRMGASDEELTQIKTNSDADTLITFFKSNKAPAEETEEKIELKPNMGLPPPEEITSEGPETVMWNPVHRNNAHRNRWNPQCRLLTHFNPETGEPEVF